MSKLRKLSLSKDQKKDDWKLTDDKTGNVVERFEHKADATKGGVLEKALGPNGGSVKIKKEDGKIQEERTYPGSKDPKQSPG